MMESRTKDTALQNNIALCIIALLAARRQDALSLQQFVTANKLRPPSQDLGVPASAPYQKCAAVLLQPAPPIAAHCLQVSLRPQLTLRVSMMLLRE